MSEIQSTQEQTEIVPSIASRMILLVIIAALMVSGVKHLLQPYYFLQTVASYKVIPSWMMPAVSVLLPSFQIALGFGMLFRFIGKFGLYCALVLFSVFSVAQASVLWRGMNIDCGCFGFGVSEISRISVLVPCSLAACCVFLLLTNKCERQGLVS